MHICHASATENLTVEPSFFKTLCYIDNTRYLDKIGDLKAVAAACQIRGAIMLTLSFGYFLTRKSNKLLNHQLKLNWILEIKESLIPNLKYLDKINDFKNSGSRLPDTRSDYAGIVFCLLFDKKK